MPLTDPGPTEVRKQKSAADPQMESLDEPSGIVCVCVWVGWFNGIYLLPGLRNHDCRVLLHTFWLRDWGRGRKKCWCDNYSYCLAGLGRSRRSAKFYQPPVREAGERLRTSLPCLYPNGSWLILNFRWYCACFIANVNMLLLRQCLWRQIDTFLGRIFPASRIPNSVLKCCTCEHGAYQH